MQAADTPMSESEPRPKMACMAEDNDIAGVVRLLDEGVDPAADEERDMVRLRDDLCLYLVPFLECLDITGVLTTALQGRTALHCAASKGSVHLVRLLVERAPQLLKTTTAVSGRV
jgi:hypothetical protein